MESIFLVLAKKYLNNYTTFLLSHLEMKRRDQVHVFLGELLCDISKREYIGQRSRECLVSAHNI